jgi:hypothetical protein
VFLIGLCSASFTFSENGSKIITQYETNDYVEIDLNISFFNQPLNSSFSDSLGNSINLGNLLNMNPDYEYRYYDLTNTTINSAFQILKLEDANFPVPGATGNLTYKLNLGGQEVFQKTFNVMSNNNLIQKTLNTKKSQLNISKNEIAKYDLFVQKVLNQAMNITSSENTLEELEFQYENAETNEEYTEILNNLSLIKIPTGISQTINTNSIVFYARDQDINLAILREIGGGNYEGQTSEYVDAIKYWNNENLDTYLTFKEIVISYGSNEKINLRIFRFEFGANKGNEDVVYLILPKMENMIFQDILPSQIGESSSGYIYINIMEVSDNVLFSTTQDVNFLDIPAFISPPLDSLEPITVIEPDSVEPITSRWFLFGMMIFLILIIGTITYILLQMWYRKKYETFLFKNRNNLFNIMTYIQTAKKKEMSNEEIAKNLKKAGWTGEQTNYAIRKYEGKKIVGIIHRPLNMPDKKPEQNAKPQHKTFNMNPGAEKGINRNNNTKV